MFTKSLKFRTLAYLYVLVFILFTIPIHAQIPDGYYDSAAGKTGSALKDSLYNIIKGHTEISYDAAYDALEITDRDPNNSSNVILMYTGWSRNAALQYNGGSGWNREHVWAKSHGDFGTSLGAGSDIHHLRPTDVSTNSARNNKDFDNGGTRYIDGDGSTDCFRDDDSWEARDAVKGDVARMIFYMATRYEGDDGEPDLELVDQVNSVALNTAGHGYHGKLSTLLVWHTNDPVDDWERNRNNIIYNDYQHNRNPFIDHPEYVALIWTDNPPPLAPSNLTATAITMTSLDLSWTDNSSDENGFNIYQNSTSIAALAENTSAYTVENLSPGITYTFTVTAFNDNSESTGASLEVTTLSDSTSQTMSDSLFFSEYIEGSSYNKALEIYNGSGQTINLTNYAILANYNNNPWYASHYSFPAGASLESGNVWVIMHSSADENYHSIADELTSATVVNYNGNDVRALVYIAEMETTFLDIIGQYNDSAVVNNWAVAGIADGTLNHTLVRKSSIRKGNPDWPSSAGTNTDDSEWIVYESDTFNNLGSHVVDPVSAIGLCNAPETADDYRLHPCYPNPFNPATTIRYDLHKTATVTLNIYDLRGTVVNTLVRENQQAGTYSVIWDGKDANQRSVSAGVYLYRMQTNDGFIRTGKMILLK